MVAAGPRCGSGRCVSVVVASTETRCIGGTAVRCSCKRRRRRDICACLKSDQVHGERKEGVRRDGCALGGPAREATAKTIPLNLFDYFNVSCEDGSRTESRGKPMSTRCGLRFGALFCDRGIDSAFGIVA
ncbi:hypothetical protein AMAG_20775 [Allomyces macrogynus ATCC 38327]|uniref:Uncharacterized protein n=1 Tax=Allomyces macrogynus (strain ATCC 38327) TaxID=578462 RepID=A0A0L0TEV8_ALLM3|nr:hypothetical protein AMAG_20775 [Allomyces macrogynus ATCC 38327]|eukprot:KNE73383.1 hypothetical protein AMAG_20775 [Allomyces macrogynus ATCC 38327]